MDFGGELRRRRVAAGLSLRDLAALVHYSRGHISKVESGLTVASMEMARLCDRVLRADGELLATAANVRATRRRAADGRSAKAPVTGDGQGRQSWSVPIVREDLVTAHLPMVAIAVVSPAQASVAQAEAATATFAAMFGQLRLLGQRVFPGVLLPTLIAQTQTLRGLAASARNPPRSALLGLAARYAEYTGWMAQEIGDDHAALWWTDEAVRLADAAGEPEMGAYALVRRALVGMYRGDAAETIELARMAQADPRASERVRGLAALREAQGHALTADRSQCDRALERGRKHLVRSGYEPGTAVLGSSAVADPAAMTTGWCLYDLGLPAAAAVTLGGEIARLPGHACKARMRFSARQALAYAAAGELDHACELTRELLISAQELASATIRLDLIRLARALNRWPTHSSVRDLQPELTCALRPLSRHFMVGDPLTGSVVS